MIPLITTVFLASLMGSLHCAGMCGAFVAVAVGTGSKPQPSRAALNAAYNGGRLVSYSALGFVAGALGAALDLGAERLMGMQRAAAMGAGAIMVAWGVVHLLRLGGVKVARPAPPRILVPVLERAHRFAASQAPVTRAVVIGLLSTLLPCGWLYAFVFVAAGTGSPLVGALTMAVFWAGTLPVLVGIGIGVQRVLPILRTQGSAIAAVAIVVVGVYTMTSRLSAAPELARTSAASGADLGLVEQVRSIDQSEMPCCHDSD